MPDYSKTVIYIIRCLSLGILETYIGSTISFTSRKSGHHDACINENHPAYNRKIYKFIRENGGWENWEMVILEEYPECTSKIQKLIREREVSDRTKATLNINRAYVTNVERAEQIVRNHARNNPKTNARLNEVPIGCKCGKSYFHTGKTSHTRTKHHCQFIMNNTII